MAGEPSCESPFPGLYGNGMTTKPRRWRRAEIPLKRPPGEVIYAIYLGPGNATGMAEEASFLLLKVSASAAGALPEGRGLCLWLGEKGTGAQKNTGPQLQGRSGHLKEAIQCGKNARRKDVLEESKPEEGNRQLRLHLEACFP